MNDELRMDLDDDCGSPEKLISVILKHHPHWNQRIPIEELAYEVGIADFQELEADAFEGALVTDPRKRQGVILTKAGVRPERKRFTIGHELGHFLIPSHKGNRQCTKEDLRESRKDNDHRKQESEANRFAAGMLMPKPFFVRDMDKLGDADVMHVQTLAKQYGTSMEATVNRYVDLTEDACAFVFSKDNLIRYIRPTANFPRLCVDRGRSLPSRCATLKAPATPLRVPTSWTEVDGAIWLETSWGTPTPLVLEQSVRQKDGYQVTLLFVAPPAVSDEDEDEADLTESWEVRFRGR